MIEALARAKSLAQLLESGSPGSALRLSVIEALAACCEDLVEVGEPRIALHLLDMSRGSAPGYDDGWELRSNCLRVRALSAAGEFSKALSLARSIMATKASELLKVPEESLRLRLQEAFILWHLNRVGEAKDLLLGLRLELLARPDSAALAQCALSLSAVSILDGDARGARSYVMEAIVSARRCGARRIEGVALDNGSRVDRSLCRWAAAKEGAKLALEIFENDGLRVQANNCRRGLGITLWKTGSLDESASLAEEALREGSELGISLLTAYSSLLKGMVLMHRGSHESAAEIFQDVVGSGADEINPRAHLLAIEFLGDIHLEQGQAAEALRHYDEVWPKALALVPKGDIVAELRRRRAECYHLLERFDEALVEARAGLDHCRELGDRYEEAATYRILALSAAALGRVAEAKQHFDQGFAYYEDIETPYEWGKLWMAYGDWLRGPHAGPHGDVRAAREAYEAARDHFERMGAQAKLAEANGRLVALAAGLSAALVADAEAAPPTTTPDQGDTPSIGPVRPRKRPRALTDLDRRFAWAFSTFGVVTRSRTILKLLEKVEKLAPSSAPVLVLGESGTGKELIAHGLHRLSGRAGQFMPINCSTLPREMIESELFGHVSGAFTGATRDKAGLLEVCDAGTVFLDEIADLPLELQARLLRFLETGEVRRVGATRNVHVKTRVVAATNRARADLERGDAFRRDLYYRLAHAVVDLPPLRRRGDDVGLLIDHFLAEACKLEGKDVHLSGAAREHLDTYGWPGNVRQLKATMRRLAILAANGHEVGVEELELEDGDAPATLAEELEDAERRRIEEALRQAGGSRTHAAKALGMPRTTLLHKMRRHGLA